MKTTVDSRIRTMSPQFIVSDIERSIEFYTKKLGFELDFRYENFYVGIVRDGFSVHLKSGRTLVAERKKKRLNEDLDIVFGVSGVDELYKEFVSKNVDIVKPVCDMPYGREFYAVDPDGYILAFLESRDV
jgi:catechol 2,3-dioxygenase-like lactoylglutathione lyase family enzyme